MEANNVGEKCVLCLEDLGATRARPEPCVNHFFHANCLRKLAIVNNIETPKCPCCRAQFRQIAIETPGERLILEDFELMSDRIKTVCFKCLVRIDGVPLIMCREGCRFKFHDNCLSSQPPLNLDGSKLCERCYGIKRSMMLSWDENMGNFNRMQVDDFMRAVLRNQFNNSNVLERQPTVGNREEVLRNRVRQEVPNVVSFVFTPHQAPINDELEPNQDNSL